MTIRKSKTQSKLKRIKIKTNQNENSPEEACSMHPDVICFQADFMTIGSSGHTYSYYVCAESNLLNYVRRDIEYKADDGIFYDRVKIRKYNKTTKKQGEVIHVVNKRDMMTIVKYR